MVHTKYLLRNLNRRDGYLFAAMGIHFPIILWWDPSGIADMGIFLHNKSPLWGIHFLYSLTFFSFPSSKSPTWVFKMPIFAAMGIHLEGMLIYLMGQSIVCRGGGVTLA